MTDTQKSWTISIGIHLLLLLLAYLVVFMPPDPPLDSIVVGGGSGVELNFGTDDFGSGDEQSYLTGGEPATDNATESQAEPTPNESQPQEIVTTDETPDNTDEDSPVEVPKKEEKKPEKKEPKPETPKTEIPKTEPQKPKPETPKIDKNALYTKKTDEKTDGKGKNGANEGDDVGKTGNKGKPEGNLDGRAYYGKPGTGGNGNGGNGTGTGSGDGNGASMNVPGWKWSAQPRIAENSDEIGKITFVVKIDEDGKVVSCTVRETTVSPSVTAVYKKAIMENTDFIQTTSGDPAPISTGTITFIIKGK